MDRFDWVRSKVYGKILDIGCNRGDLLKGTIWAQNAMGVDIDNWTPPYGLGFRQEDAHSLPFKDGEFDCSLLGEILEHVRDPVKVLKEARRVVKGCVIITVPYEENWIPEHLPKLTLEGRMERDKIDYQTLWKAATTDQSECRGAVDDRMVPHLWHIRWYTLDTLLDDIVKAGLTYKMDLLQYDGWAFFMGVLK